MFDLANTDNVKSVTDQHRPKDFLDPTEIKSFLQAAKAGRQGAAGSFAVPDDVSARSALL